MTLRSSLVAVLLAVPLVGACDARQDPPSAEATISAFLVGDWPRVLVTGEEWVAADARNPVPHLLLNMAYTYVGNRDRSRQEHATAFGTKDAGATVDEWTRKLVAEHRTNSYVYLVRGLVQEVVGRETDAADSYRAAIQHDPKFKQGYSSLGNLYLSSGRFSDAEEAYKKLLALDPEDGSAYVHLGTVYGVRGNVEAAITNFEKACLINPNDAFAYFNLGNAYLAQTRPDKARVAFARVVQITPQTDMGKEAQSQVDRLWP